MSKKNDFFSYVSDFKEDIPSGLQKVFWDRAAKSKNIEILATLAARVDASDYVLEQASQRKDIKIKVAFLSRKDLSNERRLHYLGSEQRAGVYSGLVDAVGEILDEKVFDCIDTVFSSKKTVSLAESLVNSSHTPMPLLIKSLAFVSTSYNSLSSEEFTRNFTKQLKNASLDRKHFPLLLSEFSVTNRFFPLVFDYSFREYNPDFSFILSEYSDLIKETITSLLEFCPDKLEYQLRAYSTTKIDVFLSWLVVKIIGNLPNEDLVSFLKNNTKLHNNIDSSSSELISAYDSQMSAREKDRMRGLRLQAFTEQDGKTLWSLLSENDAEIFNNLLRNPYLPEDVVLELLKQLVVSGADANDIYDFAKYFKAFRSVMIGAYYAYPVEMVKLDGWSSFENVYEAKKEVFALCSPSNDAAKHTFRSRNSYSHVNLADLVGSLEHNDPALLEVPWELYYTSIERWSRFDTTKVTEVLLQYQLEIFGEDHSLWDSFEVISRNYQGSAKDLIDTIKHM